LFTAGAPGWKMPTMSTLWLAKGGGKVTSVNRFCARAI
jgi:hypothetical protein